MRQKKKKKLFKLFFKICLFFPPKKENMKQGILFLKFMIFAYVQNFTPKKENFKKKRKKADTTYPTIKMGD